MKYTLLTSLILIAMLSGLILSTSSCTKPPNGGVPIYLHIDSPTVTYNSAFGGNTFSIPDVWATSGSTNLGAYEMPVDIPILASGNVPIAISAGIWSNGIVSMPAQYPFYAPDTFTIYNAKPGHVYHHHPVYYYYAYTQMAFQGGNFEGTNPFTNVTILPVGAGSNPALGVYSGGIILPSGVDSVVALLKTAVPIVTNGRQAFLEFDYRANNPNVFCDVGINGTVTAGTAVTQTGQDDIKVLTAQGAWVKQYFDCSNWIGTFASGTGNGTDSTATFQVYFNVNHQTGVQDTFFIDNVKLLYFH